MTPSEPGPPMIPRRDPLGHKGSFGIAAIVGGQAGATPMVGGPALSAISALRVGAGLVRLVTPQPILLTALTIAPSATGVALPVDASGQIVPHLAVEAFDRLLGACDALAIGPGLGVNPGASALTLRAVGQADIPVVVDADALNNLAHIPQLQRDFHARAILTPHPGEFARLRGALGVSADPTDQAERPAAAEQLAQRLGCVVVLKGARTVVSDGQRTWTDAAEDSALATAGTGDVLTGVIAGLLAQFAPKQANTDRPDGALSLFDCARIGVQAHALAASLWRAHSHARAGMLAVELTEHLPQAIQQLRAGGSD